MTQIDQIIADALAGSPETHVAILAREVVRLREAPAVVVPDVDDIAQEIRRIDGKHDKGAGVIAEDLRAWLLRHLRTFPADRVPGKEMVAVSASDLGSLITEIDECAKWPLRCENSDIHCHSPAGKQIRATLAAFRANHGGPSA